MAATLGAAIFSVSARTSPVSRSVFATKRAPFQKSFQESLREIFREKQGVSPKYHLTRARG